MDNVNEVNSHTLYDKKKMWDLNLSIESIIFMSIAFYIP